MRDEEFTEFVRARLAHLSRVAYLLTGDHHAAEDLVQTALLRVATRWSRVRAAEDPVGYVRKIIYHEHVSAWRRRRPALSDRPEAALLSVPAGRDEAGDVVTRLMVRDALARLTRKQRAVLVLRYFEDLTETQTAAILDCSVGNVKSQTYRALARLREITGALDQAQEVRR